MQHFLGLAKDLKEKIPVVTDNKNAIICRPARSSMEKLLIRNFYDSLLASMVKARLGEYSASPA